MKDMRAGSPSNISGRHRRGRHTAMADTFSPTDRSRVMAAVRSRGNHSTELALASALRRHGLKGWRRHAVIATQGPAGSQLRVKPDFVFRKLRLAVFVDGCFWHGCPRHSTMPKTHVVFWRRKFRRNRDRDVLVSRTLRKAGWKVVRLWEHDTTLNLGSCIRRIGTAVQSASRLQ